MTGYPWLGIYESHIRNTGLPDVTEADVLTTGLKLRDILVPVHRYGEALPKMVKQGVSGSRGAC